MQGVQVLMIRDRALITEGGGGYRLEEVGQGQGRFYPYKRCEVFVCFFVCFLLLGGGGADKVLAMLKGAHKDCTILSYL